LDEYFDEISSQRKGLVPNTISVVGNVYVLVVDCRVVVQEAQSGMLHVWSALVLCCQYVGC